MPGKTGMREGFTDPPKDASEFGGHAGQGPDWEEYGHVKESWKASENLHVAYRESPDPPAGSNTL